MASIEHMDKILEILPLEKAPRIESKIIAAPKLKIQK